MSRARWWPALALALILGPAPARAADFARETAIAARAAADRLDLARVSPNADSMLSAPLDRLALVTGAIGGVQWRTLGRMHHTLFVPARPSAEPTVAADVDTVMSYVAQVLLSQYDKRFGEAATDSAFAPYDSLVKHRHLVAFDRNQRALDRYERKYGPGSARLNLIEMGINHFAQVSPWFGPGADGPGPLEFVTGYSTTYATVADERGTAVTALEVGVRWYFFAPGWGAESGVASYFKPRFATFGLVAASARDGALRPPFDPGQKRLGPFVSWGGFKFAYLGGSEKRFLVSRQVQVLPNLF